MAPAGLTRPPAPFRVRPMADALRIRTYDPYAPPSETARQTCARKVPMSRAHAIRSANRINNREGRGLGIYRCNVCGRWHLHGEPWRKPGFIR